MTGRPAMPDPERLVRRSVGHVQRHTGCSWNTAANVVYDVVQDVTTELTGENDDYPEWLDKLRNAADRQLSAHPPAYGSRRNR